MEFQGQRFTLDLSDDESDNNTTTTTSSTPSFPTRTAPFIADIRERETTAPLPPQPKPTATGFPAHKKRTRVSAFKQQRRGGPEPPETANVYGLPPQQRDPRINNVKNEHDGPRADDDERAQIDKENTRRLASMSIQEIEHERQELMDALDPTLLQRLLKRANLDQGRGDTGIDPPEHLPSRSKDTKLAHAEEKNKQDLSPENKIPPKDAHESHPVPVPKPAGRPVAPAKSIRWEDEEPTTPIDLQPISNPLKHDVIDLPQPSIHFPTAPAAPELDPSDPSFLENLHSKYFPSLPADPSKLAWMAPIPTHGSLADQESPYYPAQDAIAASALRFDFRGGILPPRMARAVPVTKGLHHHGEAPEAAGYTIPELARLARSAFPAQRCMAFQTLGRLLYRLGRGGMGSEDSEVVMGIWKCMDEGKVLQTLEEAASAEGGHQGSKTYAIEAVWLWQKGGGKKWKAA